MRAHSSVSSEATKQASRADLQSRLEHLVQMATEVCLYAPNSELPKDFMVSLMLLLMAQLQETRPLLSRTFCQSKSMVCLVLTIIWPEYGTNCLPPNSKTGFLCF